MLKYSIFTNFYLLFHPFNALAQFISPLTYFSFSSFQLHNAATRGGRIRAGASFKETLEVALATSALARCHGEVSSHFARMCGFGKSKMRIIGHNSSPLFCLTPPSNIGFFSYEVAGKHLCRFLCACTRKYA